jgi:hypothetical protein
MRSYVRSVVSSHDDVVPWYEANLEHKRGDVELSKDRGFTSNRSESCGRLLPAPPVPAQCPEQSGYCVDKFASVVSCCI